MADIEELTHADSELVDFFVNYFVFRKMHPNEALNTTEIMAAFYRELSGLDKKYSMEESILSIKSDFEIITKVIEKCAYIAHKDIRSSEGIRDKYSDTEVYYTVPEIEARWVISGTAVRKAITEHRLRAKEVSGRKSKYMVLKADFENYANNNGIKLRDRK